jgi:hypothetical protein
VSSPATPSASPKPGASATPTAAPSATPTAAPSPIGSPTSAAIKSAIRGLTAQGDSGFIDEPTATPNNNMNEINVHSGVYAAAVVNAGWSEIEPTQGVFDYTVIDSALATIATYNATYPATPVVAKLRIGAAGHTPAWVMASTGGPITIDGKHGTYAIGAYWTSTYENEWIDLQNHLAARYDASPKIGEVAITSCAESTDEPFILAGDAQSLANLQAAGYTDANETGCLTRASSDYAAWTKTPLDFTFNAFAATDSGSRVESDDLPIQLMNAFRSTFGARAVVANHGLDDPLKPEALPLYDNFLVLGPPIEFQTYGPTVDWPTTIAYGLTYNPSEIEIWTTIAAGGQANVSEMELQGWKTSLNGGQ